MMYKKILSLLFAVLAFGFAANAMAFDFQSLRSENSFNLFDYDVYDNVIDLGDLSKVQGNYLFTNLHNSSGEDNFQLGYAGNPFQVGTLAVLFNTTEYKNKNNNADTYTSFNNNFDDPGNPVTVDKTVTQNSNFSESNSDAMDVRISYGIGLEPVRLGIAYDRHTSDWENKSGNTSIQTRTNLLNNTAISLTEDTNSSKTKWKNKTNVISAGSEFNAGPVIVELDADYSFGKTDSNVRSSVDTYNETQVTSGYSLSQSTVTNGIDSGFHNTEDFNPMGNTDFKSYGVHLAATHNVTSRFSVKGYADYNNETSDLENDTYTTHYTENETTPLDNGPFTTIWTQNNILNESYRGTVDETKSYRLGVKGYYNFDENVAFAFGLFWQPSETESDVPMTVNFDNNIATFDSNGDGDLADYDPVNNINDYTETSTGAYRMKYKRDYEGTVISIPVAVEFKATEKLTFRAGAQHQIMRTRTEESIRFVSGSDQTTTTTTYASGDVVTSQDGFDIPDDTKESDSYTDSETDYRLGLGYKVSQNLDFNLMMGFTDRDKEAVNDDWDIFAQITLNFN
ncbi:MAG: hypothetical protein HY808_03430 [Nitrospirae bacterium]|nr:hypothetical protein [Nitrospirota bacterium]